MPERLKSNRAAEFCGRNSEFVKLAMRKRIDLTYAEAERTNQIWQVDVLIRETKKRWHQTMFEKNVPKNAWDWPYDQVLLWTAIP